MVWQAWWVAFGLVVACFIRVRSGRSVGVSNVEVRNVPFRIGKEGHGRQVQSSSGSLGTGSVWQAWRGLDSLCGSLRGGVCFGRQGPTWLVLYSMVGQACLALADRGLEWFGEAGVVRPCVAGSGKLFVGRGLSRFVLAVGVSLDLFRLVKAM
jgi:hypothetical protein